MSWLSIVFFLITHLPDILSLVRQFLDLIHRMPRLQADGIRSELSKAVQAGDAAAAEQVIKRVCSGTGCPTDLVRE